MDKKTLGLKAEKIAENYLKKRGYKIIKRNFSAHPWGEIDIIAKKKDLVLFVEVKALTKVNWTKPWEKVNKDKQQKIKRSAFVYLNSFGREGESYRFDVISVEFNKDNSVNNIDHIEGAFE